MNEMNTWDEVKAGMIYHEMEHEYWKAKCLKTQLLLDKVLGQRSSKAIKKKGQPKTIKKKIEISSES